MQPVDSNPVNVIDVEMAFWCMVVFPTKRAVAGMPAAISLTIVFSILAAMFGDIFGMFMH